MVLDPTLALPPIGFPVPPRPRGSSRSRKKSKPDATVPVDDPGATRLDAKAFAVPETTTTQPSAKADDAAPTASKPKRVNRSAKGTAIELQAIKLLEAEGYKVHRCVRTGVKRGPFYFSQSNDIFGCVDLVAKKHGQRTRWIQVTADSGIGRKKKDLDEVPWDPLFDSVEIWRWVGGNTRKNKTTGKWLARQYFQVYHFDDGYRLLVERRLDAKVYETVGDDRPQGAIEGGSEETEQGEADHAGSEEASGASA